MGEARIAAFIARWRYGEGGAERANYAMFLVELLDLLDLPHPDPADARHQFNDYVFERAVRTVDPDGYVRNGRIDLYRRGCFVLEAKQSRWKDQSKAVALPDPPRAAITDVEVLGQRSARRGWDVLMRNARDQAERYARALDVEHGWPPFLIVCDVGHCLEFYADFSGQGKNYRQFPDRALPDADHLRPWSSDNVPMQLAAVAPRASRDRDSTRNVIIVAQRYFGN